jgi:hypothetical protein
MVGKIPPSEIITDDRDDIGSGGFGGCYGWKRKKSYSHEQEQQDPHRKLNPKKHGKLHCKESIVEKLPPTIPPQGEAVGD